LNTSLQAIAARFAGALRAADSIVSLNADEQRHVMRCVMRYGLVWNHLAAVVRRGHKMREEMTSDEWAAFIAGSVAYFNSHLRDFGNVDDMFGYIRTQMRWMFPELQGVRWGVWPDVLAESQYSTNHHLVYRTAGRS